MAAPVGGAKFRIICRFFTAPVLRERVIWVLWRLVYCAGAQHSPRITPPLVFMAMFIDVHLPTQLPPALRAGATVSPGQPLSASSRRLSSGCAQVPFSRRNRVTAPTLLACAISSAGLVCCRRWQTIALRWRNRREIRGDSSFSYRRSMPRSGAGEQRIAQNFMPVIAP